MVEDGELIPVVPDQPLLSPEPHQPDAVLQDGVQRFLLKTVLDREPLEAYCAVLLGGGGRRRNLVSQSNAYQEDRDPRPRAVGLERSAASLIGRRFHRFILGASRLNFDTAAVAHAAFEGNKRAMLFESPDILQDHSYQCLTFISFVVTEPKLGCVTNGNQGSGLQFCVWLGASLSSDDPAMNVVVICRFSRLGS